MIYNDTTTNKAGIVQDAYYEASANANSYPIADVTRNANSALDKTVALILGADGRWRFDDSNYTDLPIGVTDLVLGQQDYSFDEEYLVILKMEAQDSQGNWYGLIPIDNADIPQTEALSQMAVTNGTPMYYDKMGESLLLYPAPAYNVTGGLRAYFQRKIDYFTVNDTLKEPGFAKHLHKYISLSIAYAYACAKNMEKKMASLAKRLVFFEGDQESGGTNPGAIKTFYSYREVDQKKRITNLNRVKR